MHSVSNIQWSVNEAVGRTLIEGEWRLEAERWYGEQGRRLSRGWVSIRFVLILISLRL